MKPGHSPRQQSVFSRHGRRESKHFSLLNSELIRIFANVETLLRCSGTNNLSGSEPPENIPMSLRWVLSWALLLFAPAGAPAPGTVAFDLPGPQVEVRVTRAGKTLPIAQVPTLQAGDRIWVHPNLPDEQSVHYILVAAFLRGVTNPPPPTWFTKVETWNRQVREEGIVLTVPKDAQQLLLFLAPETSGDFSTLRSAVLGKPGAFVRASQDLNRASLARLRLDGYLNAIRETSDNDPAVLHDRSVLLARSLNIKLDEQCFDKPSEQQAPCLMQNTEQLVMEDGHNQSMVSTLTSGAGSDLIGQLSTSRVAGGGAYSPYVGAFVDLARLLEGFRTARYQYIPALALPREGQLNLKLNNPPSFQKPMSVLVFTLPPIEPAVFPPLHAPNLSSEFCLQQPSLVLPVEGAPLLYVTDLAHDSVLRVKARSGSVDLPVTANPARGGYVVDARRLHAEALDAVTTGTVRAYWGFVPFDGPSFQLRNAHPTNWRVAPSDQTGIIVGREDTVGLQGDDTACVQAVTMKDRDGSEVGIDWKSPKPGRLTVQLPLKDKSAGSITVLVKQYGLNQPDAIHLQAYSEAGRLDEFSLHEGDQEGRLKGTRLDQVAALDLGATRFSPVSLSRVHDRDELSLSAGDTNSITLRAGDSVIARVALKDGRSLILPTVVGPPRPKVALIGRTIDPGPSEEAIRLLGDDQLPQDAKLSFILRAEVPATFPRNQQIEVETEDGSFKVVLSLDDGTLVLEDSQNMIAELDPRLFGRSAFGPLRFRAVQGEIKGDWQPLATLVRVPSLTAIHCPGGSAKECTLSGSNLFLIDSVASDETFANSVSVPLGFVSSEITVPRPSGTQLYVKLRDNPAVVSVATPPVISRSPKTPGKRRPTAEPASD